jgi:hypothetical protein
MMRKLTAVLALSGVFLMAREVGAPTKHEILYHEMPKIELFHSEPSDSVKRYMEVRERELKISRKDEIFMYIIYAYDSVEVPEYITKKFIRAQIWAESRDYPRALGGIGERGLMQLTPKAWFVVEGENNFYKKAFDPEKNIESGIKYELWVDNYCRAWHPNWEKLSDSEKRRIIAAGYNAGIGRVRNNNWNLNKVPERTKRYIREIETLMKGKYKDY